MRIALPVLEDSADEVYHRAHRNIKRRFDVDDEFVKWGPVGRTRENR